MIEGQVSMAIADNKIGRAVVVQVARRTSQTPEFTGRTIEHVFVVLVGRTEHERAVATIDNVSIVTVLGATDRKKVDMPIAVEVLGDRRQVRLRTLADFIAPTRHVDGHPVLIRDDDPTIFERHDEVHSPRREQRKKRTGACQSSLVPWRWR